MDGFHRLNEQHGREIGDRLLCGVAQRLRSSVRLGDQIGRLAGDEFLLLVHPVESVQHLEAIAYKLQAAVAVPMDIGHESVGLSLSVGVAMYPQDAASTLGLVHQVVAALASGNPCHVVLPEQDSGCTALWQALRQSAGAEGTAWLHSAEAASLDDAATPMAALLFEGDGDALLQVAARVAARDGAYRAC